MKLQASTRDQTICFYNAMRIQNLEIVRTTGDIIHFVSHGHISYGRLQLKRRPTPSWVSYDNRPVFNVRWTVAGRCSDTFAENTQSYKRAIAWWRTKTVGKKSTVKHLTVVLTICMLTKRKVSASNMKNMHVFEALCYPFLNNDLKVKNRKLLHSLYICVTCTGLARP